MEYDRPRLRIEEKGETHEYDILTIKEFCDAVNIQVSPQTLFYKFSKGYLDFVRYGNNKLIVMNDKAKNFTVRNSKKRRE